MPNTIITDWLNMPNTEFHEAVIHTAKLSRLEMNWWH